VCSFQDYSGLDASEYGNMTAFEQSLGCTSYGSAKGVAPASVTAQCEVFPEIECAGNHTFFLPDVYQCLR